MKRNRGIVTLSILLVFFLALFAFLAIWWFGASYPFFHSIAKEEAKIPGLESGISPQGLCPLPENEWGYDYAMSGYLSKEPSRVYLIDEDKEEEFYVTFTQDGEPIKTHFGGVTCTKRYMLIASDTEIIRIALADIYAAENGGSVEITDSFTTGLKNAFCYAYKDELFVGEFYRPGNYETPVEHYVETANGTNHAFVYVFPIDEDAEGGVGLPFPTAVISVCDQVQGIAVTDEWIFLSTSYGLPDSKLYIYENKLDGEPDGEIALLPEMSSTRPLYVLAPKQADVIAPCMSEEIFVKDGKMYILFESLSGKYRYFVRTRISHVISVEIEDILDIDVKQ